MRKKLKQTTLYQELLKEKLKGNNMELRFYYKEVNQLLKEGISFSDIANLYEISEKIIIDLIKKIELINGFTDDIQINPKYNEQFKEKIWRSENINPIAVALTHFAFRNGPIENMHAGKHVMDFSPDDSQLSDADMKILNKFMANHLAYFLDLILNERWIELYFLINSHKGFGIDWDKPDTIEIGEANIMLMKEKVFYDAIKKGKKEVVNNI